MNKIVTIGIQARSTSSRFPGKVHEMIGSKTILQRIIDSSNDSAKYLNRYSYKNGYTVNVVVCCPSGDPIAAKYYGLVDVIEGSEPDVLDRYTKLLTKFNSDYVVRVTADCPLIPAFVISKLIMTAIHNKYDYISNVEPECRTTPDGWDCEVISRSLLDYVGKNAKTTYDREHVTTFIKSNPAKTWKMGVVVNHIDLSEIKISIDTKEEFIRVLNDYNSVQNKLEIATNKFGSMNVHRL